MDCRSLAYGTSLERVGGKAANLARAARAGVRTPETFVLERAAFGLALDRAGLRDDLAEYLGTFADRPHGHNVDRHHRLTAALVAAGLPAEAERAVHGRAQQLLASGDFGIAVRSSAVFEDSTEASFAGVFDSWLGVFDLETVGRRIVECWAGCWSPKALRYLDRMGIEPVPDGMAVMLQAVLPARASGVGYTANPDTGNPWEFVIDASPGLSLDLLSGDGRGDRFVAEWDTDRVLRRTIAGKPTRQVATVGGVRRVDVPDAEREEPALTEAEVGTVAKALRALDEAFATRLDVEFVVSDDGLWIVQARPLTALPTFFPHESTDDEDGVWQRASIIVPLRTDVPAGLVTPLYGDLADGELWHRYQPDDIVLTAFYDRTRDINGYRYAIPGVRTFADYFEGPLEYESWLETNEPGYRDRWDDHQDELESISDLARSALADDVAADGLIPVVIEVRDRLWDLNAFAWSGPQSLGWMTDQLLTGFLAELDGTWDVGALVAGGTRSHTYEVTWGLQQLGRSIDEPEVGESFETRRLDEMVDHLLEHHPGCRFLASFEEFNWRFGKTPIAWRDRPAFWSLGTDEAGMMHTIRSAMRGDLRDAETVRQTSLETRTELEGNIRQAIAKQAPHLAERFDKILHWARYWGQALNDRHRLTVGLCWERELIWRLGVRLVKEGTLDTPAEVLMLRRDDLERHRAMGPSAARDLVSTRRRAWARSLRLRPPDTIGEVRQPAADSASIDAATDQPVGGAPVDATSDQVAGTGSMGVAVDPTEESDRWTGVGIGSGKVTGVARLVPDLSDPALLDSLRPDDILVLPHAYAFHYADWHSLLTLVRGVVSPGQPSHHLAQVARECGVPVIGNLERVDEIVGGATLDLDAGSGVVRLLTP